MYYVEKFQCELYDKYCLKKTDAETSKVVVFYFLTILYIYIYISVYIYINIVCIYMMNNE